MTTPQDKPQSKLSSKLKQSMKDVSQQQHNQQQSYNIDFIVRPMIEHVENVIQKQFLTLHNKYQLQSYQRKIDCYQKYLLPPKPQVNVNINTNTKTNKSNKQSNEKSLTPQIVQKLQPFKPTSDQVLDYYSCFDEQINLSVQRYQKLYKKSQQNKIRLVNCVQKCSSNSKQQNQVFQTCSTKCKDIYTEFITKLYNNFYNKFLDKQ